jgi:hypothetical protein
MEFENMSHENRSWKTSNERFERNFWLNSSISDRNLIRKSYLGKSLRWQLGMLNLGKI